MWRPGVLWLCHEMHPEVVEITDLQSSKASKPAMQLLDHCGRLSFEGILCAQSPSEVRVAIQLVHSLAEDESFFEPRTRPQEFHLDAESRQQAEEEQRVALLGVLPSELFKEDLCEEPARLVVRSVRDESGESRWERAHEGVVLWSEETNLRLRPTAIGTAIEEGVLDGST